MINRVYIAGPMRGLQDRNYPAFNDLAYCIRKVGLYGSSVAEVLNPAENFADDEMPTQEQFYSLGLQQVLSADAIVMLPGWEKSEGALLEARVAGATGKAFLSATPNPDAATGWVVSPGVKPELLHLVDGGAKIFPDPGPKRAYRKPSLEWTEEQIDEFGRVLSNAGSSFGFLPDEFTSSYRESMADLTSDHIVYGEFQVKDSGARVEYASGMVRDTQEGKPDYTLLPYEFLTRWAHHMGKAIPKYGRDNWRNADSEEELLRFRSSAFRHLIQWLDGDTDEDHASAVAFNVAAACYVEQRLEACMCGEINARNCPVHGG